MNCHMRENWLQHRATIVKNSRHDTQGDTAMQALFDRLFSDLDHLLDQEWIVIWFLDDF